MFPEKDGEGPEATRGNERFYYHNNQFFNRIKRKE